MMFFQILETLSIVFVGFVWGLVVGIWVTRKVYRAAAFAALESVDSFVGFMGGAACGPAESAMASRCLPLAELVGYDTGEGDDDGNLHG